MIERTGKKVLLFRGYLGMAAALALLTVTLYLQVSFNTFIFGWSSLVLYVRVGVIVIYDVKDCIIVDLYALCVRSLCPGCHIAAWSSFVSTFFSSQRGQVHPHMLFHTTRVSERFVL